MPQWIRIPPKDEPLVTFYRFIPDIRMPQRADNSAAGSIPTRAFRFCEALRLACAFGWYVFPPIRVAFKWDGGIDITWTYQGADDWYPLKSAEFPDFAQQFDAVAPEESKGFSPPFVVALQEPGLVQIWSGLWRARRPTGACWCAPANLPRSLAYEVYEGIIETDRWFGPLFTNIRLTRTNVPIELNPELPFLQVQPVRRALYGNALEQYQLVTNSRISVRTNGRRSPRRSWRRILIRPPSRPVRRRYPASPPG